MAGSESSDTGKAADSKIRGRITAIAALVAAIAAFVGNLDKISDVAKEWFGSPEPKSQPMIVVQITRETLLEAARQAEVAANTSPDIKREAEGQAADLKRAANSIASPIRLSGGDTSEQPKWLKIAFGEMGQTEVPGPGNNPRVVEYLESVWPTMGASGDIIPWTGAFINWVFKQSGIQPQNSAAAESWLSWGQPLASPRLGALAIFSRGASGRAGFLCLYLGETEDQVLCLGGNVADSVRLTAQNKARLLAYRWPSNAEPGAVVGGTEAPPPAVR